MYRLSQRLKSIPAAIAIATAILLSSHATAGADQWSGWGLVPGDGHTNVALAATVFESKLYLFAVGQDGGMLFQTYDGSGWSGYWAEVPSGGRTDAAMAATVANDRLYLFCKGVVDKRIYMNVKSYYGGWTGWRELPPYGATTDVAPAAATTFYGDLLVFAKGIGDKRIYVSRQLGSDASWSGFSALPGITTNASPAAAWDFNTGRLLLFAPERPYNSICVNEYAPLARIWSGWKPKPGGGATDVAPGGGMGPPIATHGDFGDVRLFAKGIADRQPWFDVLFGSGWIGWAPLGGTTDVALGVTNYQSRLYLFAKGIADKQIYVNVGD